MIRMEGAREVLHNLENITPDATRAQLNIAFTMAHVLAKLLFFELEDRDRQEGRRTRRRRRASDRAAAEPAQPGGVDDGAMAHSAQ